VIAEKYRGGYSKCLVGHNSQVANIIMKEGTLVRKRIGERKMLYYVFVAENVLVMSFVA
jgi:hypothetical protein